MSNKVSEVLATEDLSQALEMYEALERLKRNKDFKKVILEGYLKDKALDSVSLLSVPQIKDTGKRNTVMEDLVSISNLQYYLFMITRFGESAKDNMFSNEEEGDK